MGSPVSDPSDPTDAPIAAPTSKRSGWFIGGVGIAVVGHILAGGPWVLAVYSFVRYATPDSWFTVDCYTVLAQLALFAGCVGAYLGLVRRNHGLGLGLVAGWAGGLAAVVLAAVLTLLIAAG